MADHMRTEAVEDALQMAFVQRGRRKGVDLSFRQGLSVHQQTTPSSPAPTASSSRSGAGECWTTRWPRASSPRSGELSTHVRGRLGPGLGGCLRLHRGLVQPPPAALDNRIQPTSTKQSTSTPTVRRHNQHNQPVRQTGSSPGQMESFHLGRRCMIARSEVERFIAHGGTKAS